MPKENLAEGPIARVLPGIPNADQRKIGDSAPITVVTIDGQEIADCITESFRHNFQTAIDAGNNDALMDLRSQYPGQYNCALILTVDKLSQDRSHGSGYDQRGEDNLKYMRRLPGFDDFAHALMGAQFDLSAAPTIDQFLSEAPNPHISTSNDSARLDTSIGGLQGEELRELARQCKILKNAQHVDLVIGLKARMNIAFADKAWAQGAEGMRAGALANTNFDSPHEPFLRNSAKSLIRRVAFFNDADRNLAFLENT